MGDFIITSPDGKKFKVTAPEGATQDQVLSYAKQHFGGGIASSSEPEQEASFLDRLGTGMRDPFEGAAQLLSHVVPTGVATWIDATNNWLADQGLPLARLPDADYSKGQTSMDVVEQQREAAIQKTEPQGFDWARLGGNVISPMNFVLPGGPEGKGLVAAAGRGATMGAETAALQPVTGGDPKKFWTDKINQIAEGGFFGGGLAAAGKAAAGGLRSFLNVLTREYPDSVISEASKRILKRIAESEKHGGPSASDAIDLINEAGKRGQPMTLSDVYPNLGGRGTLGSLYRKGGSAQALIHKFLTNRDKAAGSRLTQMIRSGISSGPTLHATQEALLRARSAAARPLWDKALALQNIWSPRLQQFLNDPSLRAGMARGYEIDRLESLAEGRPFDPTQMGVDLDADGNIKIIRAPNMQVLQMGKQGLDAMISDERNEITGRLTKRGVALTKVRKAYMDEIRALDTSGAYARALDSWEGYTSAFDSANLGKTMFQRSPEEIAAEFKELTGANRQAYLIGVADTLRARILKTAETSDEAKSIAKTPWVRMQLRPLFKSDTEYDRFIDGVLNESAMWGTQRGAMGGSETAQRAMEDVGPESMTGGLVAAGMHAAHGYVFGAVRHLLRMYSDLGLRPNPKLNEQMAKLLLMTPIPRESEAGRRLLGTFPEKVTRTEQAARGIERATSVPGARAVGYVTGARHPLYGPHRRHPLGQSSEVAPTQPLGYLGVRG